MSMDPSPWASLDGTPPEDDELLTTAEMLELAAEGARERDATERQNDLLWRMLAGRMQADGRLTR